MRRIVFAIFILCCLPRAAQAVETVPGDSCSGVPTNAWRLAGAPENAGVVNGMFCNGSTWTGVINFQSSGNVGIGTTAPGKKLSVVGAGSPSSIDLSVTGRIQSGDAFGAGGLWVNSADTMLVGADGFTAIGLYNGGYWGVILANNGNVAIGPTGSTSPAATLDVAGEIRTTGNTLACASGTAGAIRYNSSSKAFDYCGGATPAWTAFGGGSAAGSSGQVQFNSGGALAGASGLVYLSNGYVGIGTASPTLPLEVAGNTQIDGTVAGGYNASLYLNPTTANWVGLFGSTAGDFFVYMKSALKPLVINSNAAGNLLFLSGGNVGVGTTNPQATLDVVGDIHYSGTLADVSDRRAKLAIQALPSGQLGRIMQLVPVSFIMKNDPKQRTELGLIAQDVEPLYPDLVQTDSTGMKSMNYVSLIAPVIAAMQEQQREIRLLWAGLIVAIGGVFACCFVLWRVRHRLTAL